MRLWGLKTEADTNGTVEAISTMLNFAVMLLPRKLPARLLHHHSDRQAGSMTLEGATIMLLNAQRILDREAVGGDHFS